MSSIDEIDTKQSPPASIETDVATPKIEAKPIEVVIALMISVVLVGISIYVIGTIFSYLFSSKSPENISDLYACPKGSSSPNDIHYIKTTSTLNESATSSSLYVRSNSGNYLSIIQSDAVRRRCIIGEWTDVEPVDSSKYGTVHGWIRTSHISPEPTPVPSYYHNEKTGEASGSITYAIEKDSVFSSYSDVKSFIEPAVGMIRTMGWRCDTISSLRKWISKRGFTMKCNSFSYSYDFEDRGGKWGVSLSK